MSVTLYHFILMFQSTLPQGKWRQWQVGTQRICCFNPHFRKGSDKHCRRSIYETGCFNPHFRKGSDSKGFVTKNTSDGFNPHFRKGSDEDKSDEYVVFGVSIHTSAREVTGKVWNILQQIPVSIHTSAREVTFLGDSMIKNNRFQSTLPQGKWLL